MGLFGGGNEQQNGALNLGVPQQNGFAQQCIPTAGRLGTKLMAGGFMQGAGMNPQYMQQPMTPKRG